MGPEAVDRIFDLLDEVEQKIDSLTGRINSILSWVPWGLGWAVDKFLDLWNGVLAKLGEFWDKVKEIVANIGAPWELTSAKEEWASIGGPVSALAVQSSRPQSQVDAEWRGKAADRYSLALTEQQKALTGVRDKLTAVISPALGDIANALYLFFGAVAAAILIMIAGVVFATGEAVSILGLIAVPGTVITAIVACIAALGLATVNLLGAARSANTVFLNLRNNQGDFGPGNWPPAVVG